MTDIIEYMRKLNPRLVHLEKVGLVNLLSSANINDIRTVFYVPTSTRYAEMLFATKYFPLIRNWLDLKPIGSKLGRVKALDFVNGYSGGITLVDRDIHKIENWQLIGHMDSSLCLEKPIWQEHDVYVIEGYETKIQNLVGLSSEHAEKYLRSSVEEVIRSMQGKYDHMIEEWQTGNPPILTVRS